MEKENPLAFFVGIRNALFMSLPMFILVYFIGFIAVPLFIVAGVIILWLYLHFQSPQKEKREQNVTE